MANGGPSSSSSSSSRPKFFLDEDRNHCFMKKLGQSRYFVPSDAERQSAAAIRAVVDDGDEADGDPEAPSSRSAGAAGRGDKNSSAEARFDTKPVTFWTKLWAGWEEVEDQLAEWFGLDQSKYQWAVDELLERQLAGDPPASKANVDGMQNIQEQSMQRGSGGSEKQIHRSIWSSKHGKLNVHTET